MPIASFLKTPPGSSGVFDRAAYRILLVEAELALWTAFLLFGAPPILKFLLVIIPFFLALPAAFFAPFPERVLPLALAFTLAADACFVLCFPPRVPLAIVLFSVVQTVYFVYLCSSERMASVARAIGVRIGCQVLALFVVRLVFGAAPVPLLGAAYGVLLGANLVRSFLKRRGLFAFGMALFFLCDLSLVIGFLLRGLYGVDWAEAVFGRVAWVFYPPSQTVIALLADRGRFKPTRAQNIIL